MIESEFRKRFPVRAETYWRELCLNLDYQQRLYCEALGFIRMEVLEHKGDYETGMSRRLRFEKPLEAPLPIRKLVGENVIIEEISKFDPREKCWSYRMVPAVIGDRVEILGAVRLDENASGVEQLSKNSVHCKIFGIGSIIEHFVAKSSVEGNADKAAFTLRYITEKGLH
ncbi:MAG: DUF2505 family protein [Myxococcales bacterium]